VWTVAATTLLGCAAALPGGGDGVSNGGGIAEKNFVYAFSTLSDDLKSCFTAIDCVVSADDEKILRSIHRSLVDGVATIHHVEFVSPTKHPQLFVMDGKPRSARTGKRPGDRIFVNVEHLYVRDGGAERPISIRESTAILVHELAHHHGVGSSDAELRRLDSLSTALLRYLDSRSSRSVEGAADRSVSARESLLLQCTSFRLAGVQSTFTVYYSQRGDHIDYYGAWSTLGRQPSLEDRELLRIKANASFVQMLPALDSASDFDIRLVRGLSGLDGAGLGAGSLAKYTAYFRTEKEGRPEIWNCSLPSCRAREPRGPVERPLPSIVPRWRRPPPSRNFPRCRKGKSPVRWGEAPPRFPWGKRPWRTTGRNSTRNAKRAS
jgi:hypothetical protein